jgi:hypothetical protein
MAVTDALKAELDRLGAIQNPVLLRLLHDGKRIECEVLELNPLACSVARLSVEDPTLATLDTPGLKKVAEALASRLTYLLEPIRTIEVDSDRCVVQLRSNPPHTEEGRTTYYELIVRSPGSIGLARYAKQSGEARQLVPATFTREVLARLVTDFCRASES